MKTCVTCGKEIVPRPRRDHTPKKYCSQSCRRWTNQPYRLDLQKAREIRKLFAEGVKVKEIMQIYSVCKDTVYQTINGTRWKEPA